MGKNDYKAQEKAFRSGRLFNIRFSLLVDQIFSVAMSTATAATAMAAAVATATSATAAAAAAATISATITLWWTAGVGVLTLGAVKVRLAFLGLLGGAEVAIPTFKSHTAPHWTWGFAAAHLGALLLENSLAGEPDAIAFDGEHLDQHLIALFELIVNIGDAMLGHFTDVQQAVSTRKDFHEGAEFRKTNNFAEIGLAYFGNSGKIADHLQSFGSSLLVIGGDVDLAGVIHINFDAGCINDAADHLAAGANEIADLIHWNLQGVNTRGMFGDLAARFSQNLAHPIEDKHPSLAGLLQSFAHNRSADVGDLDIHLQRGNAVTGAGDFEIHIAIVVFCASNVGKNGIGVAFLHQPHSHTGNRGLKRHTGIHQGKRSAADAGHGR